MAKPASKLRDLRIAARDGDYSAARALLRLHGHGNVAAEIKRNKPWSPRVARMVRVVTAGVGTADEPGPWEWRDPATGRVINNIFPDYLFEDQQNVQ